MRWSILVLLITLLVGTARASTLGITAEATALPTESAAPPADILPLTGVTSPVHDPTLIKDGAMYYVFSTGPGIPIYCSPDLLAWSPCGRVFQTYPAWLYQAVPNLTDLWAPDITYWNGKYHLYYAASSFGSNRSVIGLATTITLNQDSKDYRWVDEGKVFSSQPPDNYNAIDPNLAFDQDSQHWLLFGSFWTGIKMIKIDATTGKPFDEDTRIYSLARRPANGPIEGAFSTYRDGYYYLFVSFDFCCKGVNSNYKIMVGRSKQITGPYIDRDGKPMENGGGSLVYAGSDRWRGPGHNAIFIENGAYYLVYHAYDAQRNGTPTLRIAVLGWDKDGWPEG